MQFTAKNWRQDPLHRKSFQHIQALFPTMRIGRGDGPISPLAKASKQAGDLLGIAYDSRWKGPTTVGEMVDSTNTDALVVLKEGHIIYEAYYNDMRPDSFHLLNSVTKSFTGTLACILIDRGYFAIDDPVIKYIPELRESAFAHSTVRHLMDMTVTVDYEEDYDDVKTDFWIEAAMVGWCPELINETPANTLLEYAQTLNNCPTPDGKEFHYRSVLTNLIGLVIERATGKSLDNSMQQYLWGPLGPEQDMAIVVDKTGQPYVGAGGNACARDLARFGQMLLQQGYYNNQQILASHWIEDTRHVSAECQAMFAQSDYGKMLPGGHYRNQFWVLDAEKGVFLALGIFGQSIHINMQTGVVSVKLSTHPGPAVPELFQDTFSALMAISESV